MAEGRRRVHERFGVELEPEVQVLGEVEWPQGWELADGESNRDEPIAGRDRCRRSRSKPTRGAVHAKLAEQAGLGRRHGDAAQQARRAEAEARLRAASAAAPERAARGRGRVDAPPTPGGGPIAAPFAGAAGW